MEAGAPSRASILGAASLLPPRILSGPPDFRKAGPAERADGAAAALRGKNSHAPQIEIEIWRRSPGCDRSRECFRHARASLTSLAAAPLFEELLPSERRVRDRLLSRLLSRSKPR